ncbi:MAG TPA: alpha/beta hydrolase-fold protein [Bacillota bacterium]|nr:alpha/beta hydrolase-fold protein [Bacillota bacterium]
MDTKQNTMIHDFEIKELGGRNKRIRVFLPVDYDYSEERYPVLYMHDGQNLVDPAPFSGYSWDVCQTAERLFNNKLARRIIIVGIDNDPKMRILEYSDSLSPWMRKRLDKEMPEEKNEPEGDIYAGFVTKIVKPFVDSHYRTLPDRLNTGVAGSSCGGNISLYMLCRYPDVYGKAGIFSPAIHVVGKSLFRLLEKTDLPPDTCIYHDMGAKETPFAAFTVLRDTKKLQKLLKNKKIHEDGLIHVIDKKATHTELFWQFRFPTFLAAFFPFSK